MKYTPPVRRVERGKGHYYVDSDQPPNRIPGVTTILGDGLPKENLINWAANATAEYSLNHWDELSDMPVADRLNTLQRSRYLVTDKAKRRGTEVHAYGEQLVKGEKVTGIPDLLRGHVENYVRFLDLFDVEPILVEVVIVNWRHGYAGTLDLVAELTDHTGERKRWLLDLKTNEKGIFPETALQLAAYRNAEFYVDDNGDEQPMPNVDACGAIHITSEFAQLVPTVSDDEQFLTFRLAAKIREFKQIERELILGPVDPPSHHQAVAKVVWE